MDAILIFYEGTFYVTLTCSLNIADNDNPPEELPTFNFDNNVLSGEIPNAEPESNESIVEEGFEGIGFITQNIVGRKAVQVYNGCGRYVKV